MGMAAGGSEGGVKSEPNVIPMIDIMLVLLIIFMIVTPVITAGFQATMPQANNHEQRAEEEGDVVLGIDADGEYYLDPGDGETRRIVKDSLGPFIAQIYENRVRDRLLYFRADEGLEYSHVEDAMDVARKNGVAVLATVVDQKREERGR